MDIDLDSDYTPETVDLEPLNTSLTLYNLNKV